jgi:S-adenosylmethionine:tRNA ribosyltransferase-isomerase
MHISAFDYELPEQLIAQEPLPERDASRMLVVDKTNKSWSDRKFSDLPDHLSGGDVLVINNTRVFPARLVGKRKPSGGRVEILLVRELEPALWETLARPGRRLKQGDRLSFAGGKMEGEILDAPGSEIRRLRFTSNDYFESLLEQAGEMPLPPYINRPGGASAADKERYQTLFARERGAIAAPTAGLHFTPRIIEALCAGGVAVAEITLHVGYGTFEPVRVENIEQHRVAGERYEISEAAADMINETRARGGRVIAVGTTTTRALESSVNSQSVLQPTRGNAELTIVPGYRFQVIDGLLTNFHLPRSSLLMLVSAFAGCELILKAYEHAVRERYRFYSYGDCMLLI